MTRIEGAWKDEAGTVAIFDALEGAGHRAYFVGGCVRDALAGRAVADVDIATDAVPEDVIRLTEGAGLRPVPTGIEHGTITVVADHAGHEVTTFRKDVETDGRRAVVAFSRDMEDDARRRDFTMNALYATRDGEVIDPLGQGIADLGAGRVRFIDDACDRIREDYLRILRFFRFHAWYGDPGAGLDHEALAAIADLADGIDALSRERIGHEMRRLLAAPDPAPSVAAMAQAGVLRHVVDGAEARYLGPLIAAEAVLSLAPDPMRRLAALGGQGAAEGLRLSRADAARLDHLLKGATGGQGEAELGYRLSEDLALGAVALRSAIFEQPVAPDAAEKVRFGATQAFPVKAEDLMPEYWGPHLGARLKLLERRWIDSGFTAGREELLASR